MLLKVPCNEWVNYNDYTQVWYASKEKQLIRILKKEIEFFKPKVLFINGIYSWYFNLVPLMFCRATRKIISVRGMLHPGALSQKAFKKKTYLLFFKLAGLHRRYAFHASDENEKKYIQDIFGDKIRVYVAKNFPKRLLQQQPLKKTRDTLELVAIALISPMKNILTVLLALQHATENIVYNIYGSVKDEPYWKTCLEKIKLMPLNVVVKYHGHVEPSKVEEVLMYSHVFILPSKSENFGHAIFEALSAGKPVITSNNTPWKNLAHSKAGINVDNDSVSLQNAISLFAAMEYEEYSLWSKNAGIYATNAIRFEEIKKQYKSMFAT
ncbi:MAG: glycosyltransferase [Ginsengibacter sp.]